MKKISIIMLLSFFLTGIFTSTCIADWLLFSKPEFKGRILDAETKKPIEGAVVVAVYHKHQYAIPHGNTIVINTREALTDEKGEFHIPSYYTIISPFSVDDTTSFIIYKPGYMSYPDLYQHPNYYGNYLEDFFAREIGERAEAVKLSVNLEKMEKIIITYGIVELPSLKTKKERLRTVPSRPVGMRADDLPLLFKSINEERKNFGLDEVG
jgi:hypothetical protein